jgi:hypothetical protein
MASSGDDGQFRRETALFGFNPVSFVDDAINCVEDYTCDGLDAMEKAVAKLKSFKGRQADVGQSLDRILDQLSKSMNKNLDLFELYALQNILQLPSNLTVPPEPATASSSSDSSPHVVPSAQDESYLDAELMDLRGRVAASKHVQRALKQELVDLEEELRQHELLAETMGRAGQVALTSAPASLCADITSVQQGGRALTEQVGRLRELASAQGLALGSEGNGPEDAQMLHQRDQSVVPLNTQQLQSFGQSSH